MTEPFFTAESLRAAGERMQKAHDEQMRRRTDRYLQTHDAIPEGLRDHPAALAVLAAVALDYPLHPSEAARLKANYRQALVALNTQGEGHRWPTISP